MAMMSGWSSMLRGMIDVFREKGKYALGILGIAFAVDYLIF
tara:strand:- start:313 stop:435 length:123 start_codon:yes stop_codon:yes gene_type:complete